MCVCVCVGGKLRNPLSLTLFSSEDGDDDALVGRDSDFLKEGKIMRGWGV